MTVDDGDGKHVLPITVRLPLVNIAPPIPTSVSQPSTQTQLQSQSQRHSQTQSTHFIPAKERKAARKAAVLESQLQSQSQSQSNEKEKMDGKVKEKGYVRNDVRVGDTVRVRGRIDEYRRGTEWVRVVVVELGTGGSVGMSSSFLTSTSSCPTSPNESTSLLADSARSSKLC